MSAVEPKVVRHVIGLPYVYSEDKTSRVFACGCKEHSDRGDVITFTLCDFHLGMDYGVRTR